MASLIFTAGNASFEEFLAVYESSDTVDPSALLPEAVTNDEVAARVAISMRLLDDGADPADSPAGGANVLHGLLARPDHDFALERPLIERLIGGGADLNRVMPRWGTPLETATMRSQLSEAELAPLYDVIFAQSDLDLLQASAFDKPVMTNLRNSFLPRPDLVARAEAYLAERGLSES